MEVTCQLQPALRRKLNKLVAAINKGEPLPFTQMHYDKAIRSYKLGRKHRILAKKAQSRVIPFKVVTHEEYNHYVNSRRTSIA